MDSRVLVSVLVPVYNVEEFLPRCIESIQNQTYQHIEIVLVDDGSTDESGKICDQFADNDPRIKVVHKANAGVAEARITAFENSTGQYVCFVDADDYLDSLFIEILLNEAENNNADLVTCAHYDVKDGKPRRVNYTMKGLYDREGIRKAIGTTLLYNKRTHALGMSTYLWGSIIRREFVSDALQQGRGLWFAEDQIVFFHILYHIERLFIMDESLYYYVQHAEQVSRRYDFSIWESQAKCWRRYRLIDTEQLLGDQLDMRIWKSIYLTCKYKMKGYINSLSQFRNEMNRVREIDIINRFFSKHYLHDSLSENMKFWLLKYRCYLPYYLKLVKKR